MNKNKIIILVVVFVIFAGAGMAFRSQSSDPATSAIAASNTALEAGEALMLPLPTPSPEPTPAPTPVPTPTPVPVYRAKLVFTGDLMVHEWQLNDAYQKDTDSYSFEHSFQEVASYLQDGDFTVGNLETTFAGKERGYAFYPTFNTPDSFGTALKNAGFDFLSTANNHSMDKHESGILRTLDQLDLLGIEHTGTFASWEARDSIYIKEINNMVFAFLSYSYSTNGIPVPQGKEYLINLLDKDLMIGDIQKAKAYNPDFIVILPHMGIEYATDTNESIKNLANDLFLAGADIIIASHPHVLQPVEYKLIESDEGERECFIAYSMGNFISSQRTEPRDAGMIINLYFEKTGEEKGYLTEASFIPTWVKFQNVEGRYNIQVLPVYDTLKSHLEGEAVDLRPKDIERLKKVQAETTMKVLNYSVPLEEMQQEYLISKIGADDDHN